MVLFQQVQMLQQQVGVLAENQVNSDDRFSRVKQDNAAYQARSVWNILDDAVFATCSFWKIIHIDIQSRDLMLEYERNFFFF